MLRLVRLVRQVRSLRETTSITTRRVSSIRHAYDDEYKNAIAILTKYSDIAPFCCLITSMKTPVPSLSLPLPLPSLPLPSQSSLSLPSQSPLILPSSSLISSKAISNDMIDDGIEYYCNIIYRNQKCIGNYNTNDFEKLLKALTSSNNNSTSNNIIINSNSHNDQWKHKKTSSTTSSNNNSISSTTTNSHNDQWKHQKVLKLYYFLTEEKVRISLESYRVLIKACSTLKDIRMLNDVCHSFLNTYKLCKRKKASDKNPNKSDYCVIEILRSLSKLHPNNDCNNDNRISYNEYENVRTSMCNILFLRIKERKIDSLFKQELLLDLAFGDREIKVTDNMSDMDDIMRYNDVKWLIQSAKSQENYSLYADEYAFKSMQWLKRKISNNKYYNLPSISTYADDRDERDYDENDDNGSIRDQEVQDEYDDYEYSTQNNDNDNDNDNDNNEQLITARNEQEKYRDLSERAIFCLLNSWKQNESFHNIQNISIKYSLAIHVLIGLRRSKALLKLILDDEGRTKGIAMPRYIYVQAMRACSVSHNWDGIVKLFTHMINQKHSPTSKALTYVTDALINTDEVLMAARILETSSFFDHEKSLNALTKVTIGLAKSGRFNHAEEIYQLAIRCHGFDRICNDIYGGNLLLHRAIWLCHSKNFKELEDHLVFCATRLDDETRTFHLFNHIVSRLANPGNELDLEQAFHFVHLMLKINVEPSKTVLDTLLDNAIDSGRSIRAASLIDQLTKYRSQSEELKMNNRFEAGRKVRGIEYNNTSDNTIDNSKRPDGDNEVVIKGESNTRTTEWLPISDNNF